MTTFIRATEVWTPTRERDALELHSGAYGTLDRLSKVSSALIFPYGEGLPGRAWAARSPIILKEFTRDDFIRVDEAHAAGITAAVALPVFAGEFLQAVLVFLCGDSDALAGAIEVWRGDYLDELSLVDGYYGGLQEFESLSRHIKFQRGRGLPGIVWKSGRPEFMIDLGSNSTSFLRARSATQVGIRAAVGIPFYCGVELDTIVTFLSSRSTPIARRFEMWCPDDAREALVFEAGIDADRQVTLPRDPSRRISRGQGVIGGVWRTGVPCIALDPERERLAAIRAASQTQCDSLLAIPIIHRGILRSVMALYN